MKEKNNVIVLLVLVAVAVLVWGYAFRKEPGAEQGSANFAGLTVLAVENPRLHWDEMARAAKVEYKFNGRIPFTSYQPPTAQEIAEHAREEAQTAKPAPVVRPPVMGDTRLQFPPNLKFFGYGTVPNGTPPRAFFTDGEQVYIVPEGETLLGRYRILKIGNTNLEFQEISSGLHGTVILEEPAPSPSA